MDRAPCLLERQRTDGNERDRAEQGDAGAVELQERQPAEDHAEVDDEEDGDDGSLGCHAPPLAAS
ncbi:hypothetical protein D3C83_65830 [compost metagenome]